MTAPDPAEAERAAVVAWLRTEAERLYWLPATSEAVNTARAIAAAIEAGEHRKEESRDGR